MPLDISKVMNNLQDQKMIFTSEVDFHLAFALEIKTIYENAKVRLEHRFNDMHIDIVVYLKNEIIPIELKYKTKGYKGNFNGEDIDLRNQAAQDIGRYLFWKDVYRLECFIDENTNAKYGYAVLLTNDSKYWECPKRKTVHGKAFSMNGTSPTSEKLDWTLGLKANTYKRYPAIKLKGKYNLSWVDYNIGVKSAEPPNLSEFKYTVAEISLN